MKKFFLVIAVTLPVFALCAAGEPAPSPTGVVKKIEIAVTRVDPSVILRELTFQEGDPLTEASLEESRTKLHKLGLLKSLTMEKAWDPALGGYRVTIKAEDGWYFIPMPIAGSYGGNTFASLMLMEHNFFRRSEGLMLFGSYSEGHSAVMGSFILPRISLSGGWSQSENDEYVYADGGFNLKRFKDGERDEAEKFGTITNSYRKDIDKDFILLNGRITPWLRATAGLNLSEVDYSNASNTTPDDAGTIRSWLLTLNLGKEGRGDPGTYGGIIGSFGRIFGLGMSGIKDSLKPLPRNETTWGAQTSIERGESWLGSEQEFTKILLAADQVTLFRNYSRLSLALKGARGFTMPPSQLLSTGQRGLLKGVYAREFRGDTLAAGTAQFSQPFFRNRIGVLTAEIYGESAYCSGADDEWWKEGAGLNTAYRFWRFPLSLGVGTTYCFDDSDWQYSFVAGGMF